MRLMSKLISMEFVVKIPGECFWTTNNRRDEDISVIEINLVKPFVFFSSIKYFPTLSPLLFTLVRVVFFRNSTQTVADNSSYHS